MLKPEQGQQLPCILPIEWSVEGHVDEHVLSPFGGSRKQKAPTVLGTLSCGEFVYRGVAQRRRAGSGIVVKRVFKVFPLSSHKEVSPEVPEDLSLAKPRIEN